jgi:RHS repeat-associated protein
MDRGTLNGTKDGISGSSSRSQDWDYDGLGNWDSLTTDGGSAQTRGHNKQNEITSIAGASTPTYDAQGNLLTDETGKQFVYDAWNRLVIVKTSGGSTLATYRYDALGRRVRETRGGTTTDLYYSDEWQVLEERVGGNAVKSYVWSPVYVDAMIARDRDTDGNGSLDERLYVVHDANFNVVALLDTSGNVVERFAYDAFGVFNVLTPAWGSRASSNYAWVYLHQGGRWDADGALYSFRRREYSPTLGRWLSNDPIGFHAGDASLYRSVRNRPTTIVDPSGLFNLPLPRPPIGADLAKEIAAGIAADISKNKCVVQWVADNPKACGLRSLIIREQINSFMSDQFPGNKDHTVENAVKHCAWMCATASSPIIRDLCGGPRAAWVIGLAHEEDGLAAGATPHSYWMDLHNNLVGISIASRGKSIAACFRDCVGLAKNYQLYWFVAAPRPPMHGLPAGFPAWNLGALNVSWLLPVYFPNVISRPIQNNTPSPAPPVFTPPVIIKPVITRPN